MTRMEQLALLISELAPRQAMPEGEAERWYLFRALVNAREPATVSGDFLRVQDEMLREMIAEVGITDAVTLP